MDNWLAIVVGVYLLAMVLYGHYRGFIRLALSMAALIITLAVVHLAMPKVTEYLREQTPICSSIKNALEDAVGLEQGTEEPEKPSVQREIIENLNLPEHLKEMLIENNNSEVYELLNIEAFTDYVGTYLAELVIRVLGFISLFLVVNVLLHIIMRWLNLVARLPILSGLNQIAGAVLGGIEGLFFFWIFCMIATAFSSTEWGMEVFRQIENSKWLSFLYDCNILLRFALGVIQGIV